MLVSNPWLFTIILCLACVHGPFIIETHKGIISQDGARGGSVKDGSRLSAAQCAQATFASNYLGACDAHALGSVCSSDMESATYNYSTIPSYIFYIWF